MCPLLQFLHDEPYTNPTYQCSYKRLRFRPGDLRSAADAYNIHEEDRRINPGAKNRGRQNLASHKYPWPQRPERKQCKSNKVKNDFGI